jgi:type III secretion system FlhB-like substrate exporter
LARCLPFFLSAGGVNVSSGGAMADKDVKNGCTRSDERGGSGKRRHNPEKGCGPVQLQRKAEKTVAEYFAEIFECIMANIKAKHLPSAKLLIDLAARLEAGSYVPEQEYMSLAAVLLADFRLEEQGAGNRDQGSGAPVELEGDAGELNPVIQE